ncbi:MAG: hypothetical protein AAF624_12590, partial [Bacteroidota bacterium]
MAPLLPSARRRALPVRPFSVRPFAGARQVARRRLAWLRRSAAAGTLTLAMLQGAPEAQAQVASTAAGAEFQVNTYTTSVQSFSAVARDADGDFVVVWESGNSFLGSQDGSTSGIYGQRYAADGTPLGSEFLVNTFTTSLQQRPAVAMDADGDFVVVWQSGDYDGDTQDGDSYGIYAQRYASDGTALGSEFQVNTYTTSFQFEPAVAMDADGDFVVAWTSDGPDGASFGIAAQRYAADGTAQGSEFQVNTYTTSLQQNPAVAMDADGDFVVVWESYQSINRNEIFGQRYSAAGTPQGVEFQVNTDTAGNQESPAIAMDADGDFVVVWEGPDVSVIGVFAQRYASDGTAQDAEFQVNTYTTDRQSFPAVAMDADGSFVTTWTSSYQDGDRTGVFAQRYSDVPASVPEGGEAAVNIATAGGQADPAVAIDDAGDFVVTWEGSDADGTGILAQRYNADGTPAGFQFQVNTVATGDQAIPAAAIDADGDFVVVWEGPDGGFIGVFAQRYAADGTAQGAEFQVATTTEEDSVDPAVAMDADGDFVVVWTTNQRVFAQRYAADGSAEGSAFQAAVAGITNNIDPSVAMDADGDFVVAWSGSGTGGGGYNTTDVYAQRFSADGSAQGSAIQVSPVAGGTQQADVTPSVAMDADGDFVVAYAKQYYAGTTPVDVYLRRYAADGTALSSETLVHDATTNDQRAPSVSSDADGDFVVVWQETTRDGSGTGVFGQQFLADGTENGGEFQVNAYTTNGQSTPVVGLDASGDFVVAWAGEGTGDNAGVFARRYDVEDLIRPSVEPPPGLPDGVPTTTAGTQRDPAVVRADAGAFAIVWESPDGAGTGIYGQRYAADGTAQGSEFQVNTDTAGNQESPAIAMDADGDFVVVWEGPDGSVVGVFAQRYAADGTAQGAEFQVATTTLEDPVDPAVAMDADGDFVVVWATNRRVVARRYAADGTAQGSEAEAAFADIRNNIDPSVAMDADGDYVVAWSGAGTGGGFYNTTDVYVQRFSADGSAQGSAIQVSPAASGTQEADGVPSVTMDTDGDFVVVYSKGYYAGGPPYDVYLRRYASDGTALSGQTLVHDATTNNQRAPSVSADADGDFVVVWEESTRDGSGTGVFGQRYAADGTESGAEFQVNDYTTNGQNTPVVALDASGGFVVAWAGEGDLDASGVFARVYDASGVSQDPDATFALNLVGAPGWRMLAQPNGTTIGDLLAPLWTQGVPGADAAQDEPTAANVFVYDETDPTADEDVGFTAVTSLNAALASGQGFIVFVFADDDFDGTPDAFPKALSVEGYTAPSGTVSPAMSFTDSGTPSADGWNLLGNVFAEPLDWDAVRANGGFDNVEATVYVWDPASNAYRTYNGSSGDLIGGQIAGGQGFFVKATAATPAVPFA